MKKCLLLLILIISCGKDDDENKNARFLIVTNSASKSHISTLYSLNDFPVAKPLELALNPIIKLIKEDVFILEPGVDTIKRYHRFSNGDILGRGALSLPPASGATDMIIVNDEKGYCSLTKSGKIMAWDPGTMASLGTIDISAFGIGDANPDVSLMAFSNDKLYVVCNQLYNGKTIPSPAQVLIIDTKNGNSVTSVTDDRIGYTGAANTPSALLFAENGDCYLYCGTGKPEENGFLRIKNGQSSFDLNYFFPIGTLGTIDYLKCSYYGGNGMVYSMGALPGSSQFGAFKTDLINKTVVKIGLPSSNGYAHSIFQYNNTLYFGLSAGTLKGFYEYEISSGKVSASPRINTAYQGDPWILATFY